MGWSIADRLGLQGWGGVSLRLINHYDTMTGSSITGNHCHSMLDRDQPEWAPAMAGQGPHPDGFP